MSPTSKHTLRLRDAIICQLVTALTRRFVVIVRVNLLTFSSEQPENASLEVVKSMRRAKEIQRLRRYCITKSFGAREFVEISICRIQHV